MNLFALASHKLYYAKKNWWKNNRLLFPSPAEVRFIQIFGGRAIVIKSITHFKTGFPLTFIISMGQTLRREYVRREVRIGPYYADLATKDEYGNKKAIEIDSHEWHFDIAKEQERDDYLRKRGWDILHIRVFEVYKNPKNVIKKVKKFLAR